MLQIKYHQNYPSPVESGLYAKEGQFSAPFGSPSLESFSSLAGFFPAFSSMSEHVHQVGVSVGDADWCFIKIDLFYIFWYKNWSDIHIFAGVFDERFL